MYGLGTIVNTGAIIVGGLIGMVSGNLIKERFQETIVKTMGFAVIVMALGSIMSQMLEINITAENSQFIAGINTQGTMMMIVSLAGGAFLGELINIDYWFERFGIWLRDKSGNSNDTSFIDAFVTTSLTVCVGAMAIIGAIQDGISGDPSTLYAKSILDFVIVILMTASMGKGSIFSAIPVAIWQGAFTILARFIEPLMTEAALSNISLVGNVLIMCVGVNLVFPKTIRVANMLPAIIIAAIFALV